MNLTTLIQLMLAYLYAIMPYLCFFMALSAFNKSIRSNARELLIATVAATATFCLASTLVTAFSFSVYKIVHLVFTAIGIMLFIWQYTKKDPDASTRFKSSDIIVFSVLILALAARILPALIASDSLGGGDARFHNILANKIILEDAASSTWAPFAPIRVTYPQGSHVFTAFISEIAKCPVHQAFNFLIALTGALTTGIIYLTADQIFHSKKCSLLAAATYAFLPSLGSLDYYRWGGLPNSLGMMILCLIVFIILDKAHSDDNKKRIFILGAGIFLLAIMLVHHYTLLVAGLFLLSGFTFTSNRNLRLMIFNIATLGFLFCLPLIIQNYLLPVEIGTTGVLKFREPVIYITDAITSLNPIFTLLCVLALISARKNSWNSQQLLILTWFTGLLIAFVSFEYLYRGAVLISTGGNDFFTCFTPSRMLTNMVYPLSILCGFIPLSKIWIKYSSLFILIFCIAVGMSCATAWRNQINTGIFPETREAAAWLNYNTPKNSMISGNLSHIEYLAWRETSNPPLPASEARNHPSVLWKKQIETYEKWFQWEVKTKRPVFFLLSPDDPAPAPLEKVFSTDKIVIMKRRK